MKRLARLAGALALGLPAAVLAHMAVFGGAHGAGGRFHSLVLDGVSLCVALFAIALGASAVVAAKFAAEGTIVAARLRTYMPSMVALLGSTALWYESIEALERASLSPSAVVLVAIACAATVLYILANAVLAAVAHGAVAILRSPSPQDLARYRVRFNAAKVVVRTSRFYARRFARPPPSLP